ncbi:hypothetical protein [Flavitalea sp.]|nr:hypothetical protein [Flavitalea sp.]
MQNYSTDPRAIANAAQAGMITQEDYKSYLTILRGNDSLMKSVNTGQLTSKEYKEEVTSWYFEKAKVGGHVRFELYVLNGKKKPTEVTSDSLLKAGESATLSKSVVQTKVSIPSPVRSKPISKASSATPAPSKPKAKSSIVSAPSIKTAPTLWDKVISRAHTLLDLEGIKKKK